MINFSFIIPHKNTPDLLQKCLDSIPRREDVEIIVVDDNSDPEKVDFESLPGMNDPSVTVVLTKEGKGAGFARNVGMDHAQGKWILFADSDDTYNCIVRQLLDQKADSRADVVLWKTNCIDLDTGGPGTRGSSINRYTQEALDTGSVENALIVSAPYKGMYSRSFLSRHHIRFNESRWGNDVLFSSRVAVSAEQVEIFDHEVYCISSHSRFGLISNPGIDSSLVRFHQEAESTRLLNKRYRSNPNVHHWFFQTWFAVYKLNKKEGLLRLPRAITTDGLFFIKECLCAVFS